MVVVCIEEKKKAARQRVTQRLKEKSSESSQCPADLSTDEKCYNSSMDKAAFDFLLLVRSVKSNGKRNLISNEDKE